MSRDINQSNFLTNDIPHVSAINGMMGPQSLLSAPTICWAWRNKNMMCLGNEIWSLPTYLTTLKVWLILLKIVIFRTLMMYQKTDLLNGKTTIIRVSFSMLMALRKKKSLFDVLKITNILNLFNLVIY